MATLCLPVYADAKLHDKPARPFMISAHQRRQVSSSALYSGRAPAACMKRPIITGPYRSHSEFHSRGQGKLTRGAYSTARSRRPFIAAASGTSGEAIFGNRIPQYYFTTTGFGDTDEGAGEDPWETGSYDLALQAAGIENFNIQTYTSVIPTQAVQLPLAEAKPYFQHGAVLECIMASMNGTKGDRISAGVGTAKVRKRDGNTFIGGFAAEYRGHCTEATIQEILFEDLQGIFKRRYDASSYKMYDYAYVIEVEDVSKSYGTVLASLCFISFIEPSFVI